MKFDQRATAGLRKLRQILNGKQRLTRREVSRERLSRFVRGLSMESLERRDLLATDIINLPTLNLTSTDQLVVELGGSSPGHSALNDSDGYDQYNVAGAATLDGTLAVQLVNNYAPLPGTTFSILNYASAAGEFDAMTGLTYAGGELLPIQGPDGLTLVASPLPTGHARLFVDSASSVQDVVGFFQTGVGAVTFSGSIEVSGRRLSGSFLVESELIDGHASVGIAASNVSVPFLSDGGSAITLSSGSGALLITDDGFAATVSTTLTESLKNVDFGGVFSLTVSNSPVAIDATFDVGGETLEVHAPAGDYFRATGTGVTLSAPGMSLAGDIAIEAWWSVDGAPAVIGAAAKVRAFVGTDEGGPDERGVRVTDGEGVFLINSAGIAADAAGAASVVGMPDLTLSGTLAARINNTGAAVDETIELGGTTGHLVFTSTDDVAEFFGSATLSTPVASLSGEFSVSASSDGTSVAATNVSATVGTSAAGVRIDNAKLDVELYSAGGYALYASGSTTVL
ncbi:MAG TPA: hypothetical protein PLV92_21265, partial [Pirellulaceae bacterium]|nr:hypothetical protein [Pirellulaceae bacterium]